MRRRAPPTAIAPLAPPSDARLADLRPDLAEAAGEYADASLSAASRRALRDDWTIWEAWCKRHGFSPLPATPEVAVGFLADYANSRAVATLLRYRATVGKIHKLRGHPSPFVDARVQAVLRGIRRKKDAAQRQAKPMTLEIAAQPVEDWAGRDRAVLMVGLALACRGAELCSLNVEDLTWVEGAGCVVHLRKSKTDQLGKGRDIGVPFNFDQSHLCPALALRHWLGALGETSGPLFRGFLCNGKISKRRMCQDTISDIVKRAVARAGLDPSLYSAHSLRAGYVTEARKRGHDWATIMVQTGHKRLDTVQRYARGTADPFKDSKVADVFKETTKNGK